MFKLVLLPGGPHFSPALWPGRWEALHGYPQLPQHDWQRPLRGDWLMQLEEAVLRTPPPLVLVAQGLGCILLAAWAAHSRNTARVRAAWLVAPCDVEREALRAVLPSWSPIVRQPLPFPAQLLSDRSNPFCSPARAQALARDWGADWLDDCAPPPGPADADPPDWPQGHARLLAWLAQQAQNRHAKTTQLKLAQSDGAQAQTQPIQAALSEGVHIPTRRQPASLGDTAGTGTCASIHAGASLPAAIDSF